MLETYNGLTRRCLVRLSWQVQNCWVQAPLELRVRDEPHQVHLQTDQRVFRVCKQGLCSDTRTKKETVPYFLHSAPRRMHGLLMGTQNKH